MNRFLGVSSLLISLTLLTACTSNPRVQSDYDGALDSGQYITFDFENRAEIENPDLAGNLELYFSAAVMQELQAKGLVRSANPDILINVSVELEEVSSAPVRANNCPRYNDYYSRRVADSYDDKGRRPMCIYTEGSVAVELMDVGRNLAVMEGVSLVRLDDSDRGDALLQSVVDDVATMFGRSSVYADQARAPSFPPGAIRHHNN